MKIVFFFAFIFKKLLRFTLTNNTPKFDLDLRSFQIILILYKNLIEIDNS